jgi:hypothetical protein
MSRLHVTATREATFMDLFLREVNSCRSNPLLPPANPPNAACATGLKELKSVFEWTSLGPSPPCNIVFAWHGTPVQQVEAVCHDGPRAFRTTDGGYFGTRSYFAAELEYFPRNPQPAAAQPFPLYKWGGFDTTSPT